MPIKQFCLFNLTAGNLTHRYLHGAMLDQSLADESNGQVLWTLTDNLGTVRDLVNSAGVVQNQIKYDSFGNVTSQTNASIKKRFGYTGRELDDETGLYYYRARYYDAVVGRFISEDPISFAGGDVNLYRYVGNNPVDRTDPGGQVILRIGDSSFTNQLIDFSKIPITKEDDSCWQRCMEANGAIYALEALIPYAPFGTIPKNPADIKLGGQPYTSLFSKMLLSSKKQGILYPISNRQLRQIGAKITPVTTIIGAFSVGYLLGLTGTCFYKCVDNPNCF